MSGTQDHKSLHEDHMDLSRQARRYENVNVVGGMTVLLAVLTLGYSMWARAEDSHAQTQTNTQHIVQIEKQISRLSKSLDSNTAVSSELASEVSALRAEAEAARGQRERLVVLLDRLEQRILQRDAED